MKIGIFGGSFNPPHIGHLFTCSYVLATSDIDEIWVIPVTKHPFDKPLVESYHRYNMCVLMFDEPRITVYNIDNKFTVDMLEEMTIKWPMHEFFTIIGSDVLKKWDKWKNHERVRELAPPIVVDRGEQKISDVRARQLGRVAIPNVSSTEIRHRLKNDLNIDGLVPLKVLEYINFHKLEF